MRKTALYILALMVGYFGTTIAISSNDKFYVDAIILYGAVVISLILLSIDHIQTWNTKQKL